MIMFSSIAFREQAPQDIQQQRRATIAWIEQVRESDPQSKADMEAQDDRGADSCRTASIDRTRDASDVENCIPPTEVQRRCDVLRWRTQRNHCA
jgi:hypothetical protein